VSAQDEGGKRTARLWLGAALGAALALVLAVPFALSLLRPRQSEAARRADLPTRKLIIISPHWEGIRYEFEQGFSEWTARQFNHRTQIEWLDVGGTSDALRYVRSEFSRSPRGINIDLFFGGGVDPYLGLLKDDLLEPCQVPVEVLEAIPQRYAGIEMYAADGRWFGACLSGFGILVNKRVLELVGLPRPESWADLARPEYLTWVGSGDPRSSGSVHMVYEIIAQAYGWEEGWANIVRMGANIRNFSRSASQTTKDCALGEVACAMAIDLYAWNQVVEVGPDRMEFILPEGATVVNPDGIAILKGAPHKELAEEFITFVLSEAGQKLWTLKVGAPGGPRKFALYRMPMIPGFAARFGDDVAVAFDPFTWKGGFTYDSQKGSTRWTILNDLIGAYVIDAHDDLVAAWRTVRHLPPSDPRVAELVRPPLSEQQVLALARDEWSDAAFRARTRAEWASEASRRYRRIAGGR